LNLVRTLKVDFHLMKHTEGTFTMHGIPLTNFVEQRNWSRNLPPFTQSEGSLTSLDPILSQLNSVLILTLVSSRPILILPYYIR